MQIGTVGDGGVTFACPHCHALYAVTIHRTPKRTQRWTGCQCCGRGMAIWDDAVEPRFVLIAQPANDAR